ncbi:MAG: icmX, partial [Gammaproteobacteria bacterium]|nr:icmX [Gammaproteobacteria bacterium]
MRNFFCKIGIISLITATSLFASQAQADNSLLQAIANGVNQLVKDAKGKWETQLKLLYEKTPNVEQTIITNANNINSNQQINAAYHNLDPQDLLAKNIQDSLQPLSANNDYSILAAIPGSDLTIDNPIQSPFASNKTVNANPNNAIFNFNSLLNPDVYQTIETDKSVINQRQLAKNYIEFLFQGSKLPNDSLLDLTALSPKQFEQLVKRKDFTDYVMATRSYAASQSSALSNLYAIYNKRLAITDLGKKAGFNQEDASVKQIENYLASRRVSDINWYQAM